uniref:LysM domain-containing protein n=1 Tax=Arcella intermedia TaxID=1963864 RepID=A0A6B2LHI1_9EUKA
MKIALVFLLGLVWGSVAQNITAQITFYGARDNCPPGGDIAHPIIHNLAGGTGTYEDPITYAGDTDATPAGTIIYYPTLKKYFIMEDDCEECINDWKNNQQWHFDLWMGPDTLSPSSLVACENALTVDSDGVWLKAPAGLPVDPTPLYSNGNCIIYAPPCTDTGNTCGNSCEIPDSASCAALAQEFMLSLARFEQLNPDLDCTQVVPAGTSVCQGGTCGD